MAKAQSNRVTINRGLFNRRHVHFLEFENLRPTPARVREAVFNMLCPYVAEGYGFLDACAGSGVMGFTAASCGFKPVIMLETNADAMAPLEKNKSRMQADVHLYNSNALAAKRLPLAGQPWVCYADPPFTAHGFHTKLMRRLSRLDVFAIGSIYVAEHDAPLADIDGFEQRKSKKYGRSFITIREKTAQIPSVLSI